ncbi:hypothetical protein [Desulfoscipio geothermicus]|uniref:Uncharacterized protein n=1 Tax=Desulfoscipio geothermicus DSM 3669 TaxID=1121426 RepID=A0A1I6DFZ7_9FIRM|nr:hypothetical protein [Desulfoscipio geothermicus]SFR04346.1 hypothetical protein SAMN05660706_11048 [Desulfoscipio geothermicus DSM 3669]
MPGLEKGLEKRLVDLLEIKKKHDLENDKFLLLLGMVNLMGIINMLEERTADAGPGRGARRPPAPSEMAPLMGMFGPKGKQ